MCQKRQVSYSDHLLSVSMRGRQSGVNYCDVTRVVNRTVNSSTEVPGWEESRPDWVEILQYYINLRFSRIMHLGLYLSISMQIWPTKRRTCDPCICLSARLPTDDKQGCQICHQNWVRLAPNGTNLGLFKINKSHKLYFKKSA